MSEKNKTREPDAGVPAGLAVVKGQFSLIEHPADLGIEAQGPTLAAAFEQAAHGFISILVDPATVSGKERREVFVRADDLEQLLVRWLSEVLYLYDGQHYILAECRIHEITPTHLRAVLLGEAHAPERHTPRTDIKAVTYHQIAVESGPTGTCVRVFLDI
jgi:SHS2 domain-containing protein